MTDEIITEELEYSGPGYTVKLELCEYDGEQAVFVHLEVLKNTPEVHKAVHKEFVDLVAVLSHVGVKHLLATSDYEDEDVLKFQLGFGFMPWKVHELPDGRAVVVSRSEILDGC